MSQLSTFYPENVTAIKGTTGTTTDNSVLRADGVGGSTAQASDLVIEDAATTPQNNVAVTNQHSGQTNSSLVLCNKGTGAFIVSPARPDSTSTGGNSRGASSVCIVPMRNNANQVASGANSVAIGAQARAGGTQGVVIGFGSTDGTGNNAVAIGSGVNATTESVSIGYSAVSASGAVSIGQSNASGTHSVSLGSSSNSSLRAQFNCRPFAAVYWGGQTTDATANVTLNLDATGTNPMTIAANTAVLADIYVVARQTDNTRFLAARRWVAIRRDGSNNTALIGGVQTIETDQSEGSPAWTFTIDADDTASVEALRIRVTGAASQTVNWRVMALYRVVA